MCMRQPVWQRSGEPKLVNGKVAQPAFLELTRSVDFGRLLPFVTGSNQPSSAKYFAT
jgi:hypothetical protein